ncbi:MAG TPA: glutamyl-tRNA reductase [Candidatus Limnocylindrales bacterium]|nr:glutamyl-tRNA reductase [Candidatus Limnocylindrales bacterium]
MFVLVGLSHRTAPIEVREKAFVPESGVGECVQRLIDRSLIESGVMLSTCNRTELYAVSPEDQARGLLEAFAWWPHELPFETWQRHAYQLEGEDAVRHLFQVASGLDSMVLGEGQVLGQLKRALALASEAGTLDPELQIILRGALRAGKRVRHETELGRRPVSVGHAAVTQAAESLGSLKGRGVLLIGAGPMSEVAMRLFRNQGLRGVFVASRTLDRAERVARALGGTAVAFDAMDAIIDQVDVILSSSSAPFHLFDAARMAALQGRRGFRPLVVIDIAVPRDVDPAVAQVEGVALFNIDDLQRVADRGLEGRRASIDDAERLVDEELARTTAALGARTTAPLASALVERLERLRDAELARVLARVPESDVQTRMALTDLADGLTSKFLHHPLRHLRETEQPHLDGAVLRDAFDLEPGARADG